MKTNNFTDDGPKSEDAALFFIGSKSSVSACMQYLFMYSKKFQKLLAFHHMTINFKEPEYMYMFRHNYFMYFVILIFLRVFQIVIKNVHGLNLYVCALSLALIN